MCIFYEQDWKDIKRKNHGLEATPSDSMEPALYLHPAALLASAGKKSRRRYRRRPQGRTAEAVGRLQGKHKYGKMASGVSSSPNWKLRRSYLGGSNYLHKKHICKVPYTKKEIWWNVLKLSNYLINKILWKTILSDMYPK